MTEALAIQCNYAPNCTADQDCTKCQHLASLEVIDLNEQHRQTELERKREQTSQDKRNTDNNTILNAHTQTRAPSMLQTSQPITPANRENARITQIDTRYAKSEDPTAPYSNQISKTQNINRGETTQ